MPKIISTFSGESPLASTIANFGKSMWGNSTENAINNEKLYALQRQNTETDNYAKRVAEQGMQNLGADSLVQAMIIASGYDPAAASKLGLMGAATDFGAKDPRTQNWQIASGQDYDSTAAAFDAKMAEATRSNNLESGDRRYNVDQDVAVKKWLNENLSASDALTSQDRRYGVDQSQLTERTKMTEAFDPVTGQPVFRPADQLESVQPIISEADRKGLLLGQNWGNLPDLNPEQRQVLGANPTADRVGTPKNYIVPGSGTFLTYDGVTDVYGKPLPLGGYIGTVQGSATDTGVTKATRTDLESDTIANKKFNFLLDKGLALTADPTLFGPEGYVRSTLQEIGQGLKGVSTLIDPDPAKAAAEVQNARAEARSFGVNIPELYDPRLSEVETIWGLLVYQGASALAGQENRSVSDKDVEAMRAILGSPQGLFSSANSMKSKLNQARAVVSGYDAISREALKEAAPVTSTFDPTNPAVTSDQPVQIKGIDDYNALPIGTKFIDPSGVPRTKGER